MLRWVYAAKDSFVIPKEELKDFYLKFAFLLNPDSCSINRTEFELLNILLKDLKKILAALTHLNTHPWDEGIAEIQISCGVYSLQDNLFCFHNIIMNKVVGEDFLWKKSGSAFPVTLHQPGSGCITLHTGVRNRHMKHQDRHKNACHENEAGSLPGWYEEYHKDTTIFFFVKNKRRNKKVRVSISLFYAVLN